MADVKLYCDTCNYSTLIKSNLVRHKKSKHENIDDLLHLQVKKKTHRVSKFDALILLANELKYEIYELKNGINYLKLMKEPQLT